MDKIMSIVDQINTPVVSVMMLSYNAKEFISAAVDSVLSQDWQDFEIIIADDGSNDGTQEIIKQYKETFPAKFVLSLAEKNLGITANSNKALQLCRGKYIALAYADDIMLPGKLSAQVFWFSANPNAIVCGHPVEIFDSSTNRKICVSKAPDKGFGAERIIRAGGLYQTTSIMFKRTAVPEEGFDERIDFCSDFIFFASMLASTNGYYGMVPTVLARYRRHGANATKSRERCIRDIESSLIILSKKYPAYKTACNYAKFQHVDYQKAIYLLADGIYIECLKFLILLSRRYPFQLKIYLRLLQLPLLALVSYFFPDFNKLIFPHKRIGL
jgi:glycosyltransferase involved in cell wall biosynthesis